MEGSVSGLKIASFIVRNDLDDLCPEYRLKRHINKSFKRVKLDKLNLEKELSKLKELEKEVEYVLYKPFQNDKNLALLYLLESPNCTELLELLNIDDTKTRTRGICMLLFILERRVYSTNMMFSPFKESGNELNLAKSILNLLSKAMDSLFVNDDVIINYTLRLIFECVKRVNLEYLSRFLRNFNLFKYLNKCHVTTHSDIKFTIYKAYSSYFELLGYESKDLGRNMLNLDGMEVSLRRTFSSLKSLLKREESDAGEVSTGTNINGKRAISTETLEEDLETENVDLYYSNGKMKLAIILVLGIKGIRLQKDLVHLVFSHFKHEHWATQIAIAHLSVCYLSRCYQSYSNEANEKKSMDYLINNINNSMLQLQKLGGNIAKGRFHDSANDGSTTGSSSVRLNGNKVDEGVVNIEVDRTRVDASAATRVVKRILREFVLVLNGNMEDNAIVSLLLKYELWFISRELDGLYRINGNLYKQYVNQMNVGSASSYPLFVEIMVKYLNRGFELPEYVTKGMLNSFLSVKSMSLLNSVFKLFMKIMDTNKNNRVLPDIKTIINLNPTMMKSSEEELRRYELEAIGNWLELLYRSNFSGSKGVYDPLKLFKIPQIAENYALVSRYMLGFIKNKSNHLVDKEIISVKNEHGSVSLGDEEASKRMTIDMNLISCMYHLGINDSLIISNLHYKCLKLLLARYLLVNSIIAYHSEDSSEAPGSDGDDDSNEIDARSGNTVSNADSSGNVNCNNDANLGPISGLKEKDVNRIMTRPLENKLLHQYNSKLRHYLKLILSNVLSTAGECFNETGNMPVESGHEEGKMEAYVKNVNSVFLSNLIMVMYNIIIKSNIQLLYPLKEVKGLQASGVFIQLYKCLNCILNGYFHGNIYMKLLFEILLQVSKYPELFDGNLKYYRCVSCNNYYVNYVGLFDSKYAELRMLTSDLVEYNENTASTEKNKSAQKDKVSAGEKPVDKDTNLEKSKSRILVGDNLKSFTQYVNKILICYVKDQETREYLKMQVLNLVNHLQSPLDYFTTTEGVRNGRFVQENKRLDIYKGLVQRIYKFVTDSRSDGHTSSKTKRGTITSAKGSHNHTTGHNHSSNLSRSHSRVMNNGINAKNNSSHAQYNNDTSIRSHSNAYYIDSVETRTKILLSNVEDIIGKISSKKEEETSNSTEMDEEMSMDTENKLLDYVYYYVVKLIETNDSYKKIKSTLKPYREESYDLGLLSDYVMNKHKTMSRQLVHLLSVRLILGEDSHEITSHIGVKTEGDVTNSNGVSHTNTVGDNGIVISKTIKSDGINAGTTSDGNNSPRGDARKESNRKLILLMILVNNNRELQELIINHKQTFKLLVNNLQRLKQCGNNCTYFDCNLTLLYLLMELLYLYIRRKCKVTEETKEQGGEGDLDEDIDTKMDDERNNRKHRRLMGEILYSDWFPEKCELILRTKYYYLGHSIETKLYTVALKILYSLFFSLKYEDTRKMDKDKRRRALGRYYVLLKDIYKCTNNKDDVMIKQIMYKIIRTSNKLDRKRQKVRIREPSDDFEFYLKLLDINHFKLVHYSSNVYSLDCNAVSGSGVHTHCSYGNANGTHEDTDDVEDRDDRDCHGHLNNWLIYNKALVFMTFKGGDLGQLRLNLTLYSHNKEDVGGSGNSEDVHRMSGDAHRVPAYASHSSRLLDLDEFPSYNKIRELEEVLDYKGNSTATNNDNGSSIGTARDGNDPDIVEDSTTANDDSIVNANDVNVTCNDGSSTSRSNTTTNSTSTVTRVNGTADLDEDLINSLECSNRYYYNNIVDALLLDNNNIGSNYKQSLREEDILISKMTAFSSRLNGPEELNKNEIICSLMMPDYYNYDLEYLMGYVYKLLLILYYSQGPTNATPTANSTTITNTATTSTTTEATITSTADATTTSDSNKRNAAPSSSIPIKRRRYEFDTVHVNMNNVVKLILCRLAVNSDDPLLIKMVRIINRVNTDTDLKYILYHIRVNRDLDEIIHIISLFNTLGRKRDRKQIEVDRRATELDRLMLKSNLSNLSEDDVREVAGRVSRVLMNSLIDGETQLYKVVKILSNLRTTNRKLFNELYLDNYIAALKSTNWLTD
ncbi:hypothetical protein MACJ_001483 [Theileria orientalis]|uniref:Uncharacterized protein n=1 Tax=Theileria orientalis TaxID=68886 RepID=A0A976M896_THEOR|nr:hypothetical protein MACJ_001483 [Theileria orientalis]